MRSIVQISVFAMAVTWAWAQPGENPQLPANANAMGLASTAPVDALRHLDPKARDQGLRRLVESGGEDVTTNAMIALVHLCAPNLEPLFEKAITRLSDLSILMMITSVKESKDKQFRTEFARTCLRREINHPDGPIATENHPAKPGVAWEAAQILAFSSEAVDRDLVRAVLAVRPKEAGVWLALAAMGLSDDRERALARSVWNTEWGQLQLAAAAALAPYDKSAREFYIKEVTRFLSEFGGIEVQDLFSPGPDGQIAGAAANRAMSFLLGLCTVKSLLYVSIPEAEHLTFDSIDCANAFIRGPLGLIAAKRWPDRLVRTPFIHNNERMDLLAAIAELHPQMAATVKALMPTQEFDSRMAILRDKPMSSLVRGSSKAGLVF